MNIDIDVHEDACLRVVRALRSMPAYKHYSKKTMESLVDTITGEYAVQLQLQDDDTGYPYDREILSDSKFYPLEEIGEGCDTCDNCATHQTFGSDDELYLACVPCLIKHKLPMEDDDNSIEDYNKGIIKIQKF